MNEKPESQLSAEPRRFIYAPFSSQVVREATSFLVQQVLPDAHKYDLNVIDDTSGRLLGLVARHALNEVRHEMGLPNIETRVLADASTLAEPEALWKDIPCSRRPLIITDSIAKGGHLTGIIRTLTAAGFEQQSLGLMSLDVRESRLSEERRELFERGIGQWYYLPLEGRYRYVGDEFMEAVRVGMTGFVQHGGAFAVRANLVDPSGEVSDVPYLRAVREDCKVLAHRIVTEYFES